jgi:hypothetical protein
MEFKKWSKTAECENMQINRTTNQSIWTAPNGTTFLIIEFFPSNWMVKPKCWAVINNCILKHNEKNVQLLKKYNLEFCFEYYTEEGYGIPKSKPTSMDNYDQVLKTTFNFVQNEMPKLKIEFEKSMFHKS